MSMSSKWAPSPLFSNQNLAWLSLFFHVYQKTQQFNPPWFYQPNNIWWGVKSIKLIITKFFQLPATLSLYDLKIILSTLLSNTLSLCYSHTKRENFHIHKSEQNSGKSFSPVYNKIAGIHNFYVVTETVHIHTHIHTRTPCPHTSTHYVHVQLTLCVHTWACARTHTHTHTRGIYELHWSNAHTNLSTDVTGFWFVRFEFLPNNGEIGFMCCESQHY